MFFQIIASLKVQKEELKEIRQLFDKIDLNQDGFLSKEEV